MNNPFDDQEGAFFVLINSDGQYSLWPSFADIPEGWAIAFHRNSRQACLDYINAHWTDMRPNTLKDQIKEYTKAI